MGVAAMDHEKREERLVGFHSRDVCVIRVDGSEYSGSARSKATESY